MASAALETRDGRIVEWMPFLMPRLRSLADHPRGLAHRPVAVVKCHNRCALSQNSTAVFFRSRAKTPAARVMHRLRGRRAVRMKPKLERAKSRWYFRWWSWTALGVVLFTVGLYVGLQPLARYATQRALDSVNGYFGSFEEVHVSLLPLRYRVTHLKLEPTDKSRPLIYAEKTVAGVDWKWLLHGRLRLAASVYKANLVLRETGGKAATQNLPDLANILVKVLPGQLHRLQLRESEITYILHNEKGAEGREKQASEGRSTVPKLWLHELEATVENLATRPELAEGATTFAASALLNNSGNVALFATADPLAKVLTFAGQFSLQEMKLADAYNLVDSKSDLVFTKGTLDLLARFGCDKGHLSGAIQPVIKNAEIKGTGDIFSKVKGWAANLGVQLLSDRVPGRNAVSTVIPIEGTLTDPQLQLWPTIFGIIRNAFVEGIAESFTHLPTPRADRPQGILEQAASAVSKDAGLPKAQPAERK
jgi:hypothetical protein